MKIKFTKRQRTIQVDKEDLGDLDITLAEIILATLVAFRDVKKDIPHSIHKEVYSSDPNKHYSKSEMDKCEKKAMKIWLDRLDKMIFSFNDIANAPSATGTEKQRKEHAEKVQEGLDLFAKHFTDLWY